MQSIGKIVFLIILSFGILPSIAQNSYPIIPQPLELKAKKGSFVINEETKVYIEAQNEEEVRSAFFMLNNRLNKTVGFELQFTTTKRNNNIIVCTINKTIEQPEAYRLKVASNKIEIEAPTAKGIFYALQTIRQLLPTDIEKSERVANLKLSVPNCEIKDEPQFSYRGVHLDVCRHFIPMDELKEHIDQMALLKINTFHWHLTDDQGWRLEIKKYPKLTEIGASRYRTLVGHHNDYPRKWDYTPQGGYYTQDEARELIAYAAQRHIRVIPEIEMPGHATAALASYPEYSCSGGPFDVEGRWGVFNDVFCTREETFDFLEDVLTEVAELFPSEYLHIGGDECPKVRWERCHACQTRMKEEGLKDEHELQSYFVKRIERFLSSKGKRIIGWDEILDGGIAPNATVMSWRGIAGGVNAAKQGHDVIMTPSPFMYFDFYQSKSTNEQLAIGGYVPIESVYNYKAFPTELTADEAKHILGIQANLWTEYLPKKENREYMLYPRMAAMAEVAWLKESKKDYKRFATNLHSMMKRYDNIGVNHANTFYGVTANITPDKEHGLLVELTANNVPGAEIRYTLDSSEPTLSSPIYTKPIPVSKEEKTIKAVTVSRGKIISDTYTQPFIVNKAAGQRLIFANKAGNTMFEQNGAGNITDCIKGKFPLGRDDWFSYAGEDGSIIIEFGEPTQVSEISVSTANQNNVFVYSPKKLTFEVSEDGEVYRTVGVVEHRDMAGKDGVVGTVSFGNTKVQKVRVNFELYDVVSKHGVGAGTPIALFMDEIIVR